jgi:oligopeptide/dipeptide ABC transporter ATP-binding protein
MTGTEPLLDVRDLTVTFPSDFGPVRAVTGASFAVHAGERVGLVGESGSGKTVTALSIMGLVAAPPARVEGRAMFAGRDLLTMNAKQMQAIRGTRIGMIFQNPLNCLNPAMRIGAQIDEVILAHENVPKRDARARSIDLLGRVGIPAPRKSADEFPHKFSGGMRQRVMIAVALACSPNLVIADEPTTALDVTIQGQIIELLMEICAERDSAVLLITHDLGVLAGFAERIIVMYAGRVVEQGPVNTIYYGASHPYTWGLMTSVPRMDEARRERLVPIAGNPPSAVFVPPGCPFHPRCPHARAVCKEDVPALIVRPRDDHPSACHFAGELTPPDVLTESSG